jgi:hypothetical protein
VLDIEGTCSRSVILTRSQAVQRRSQRHPRPHPNPDQRTGPAPAPAPYPRRRHHDRIERVHSEQLEFVDIYAEQIQRWRTEGPSAAQTLELDRLEKQNRRLREVTTDVIALAHELGKGIIDRIMAMSDLELGLQTLLGIGV